MHHSLGNCFDRIVCINLDRCADRWRQFQESIAQTETPITSILRFPAIDGSLCTPPNWWQAGAGAWGCHQSHVRVIQDALQDRVQSLLIFEDDAIFASDFAAEFNRFWEDLPSNWDGLLLGGQHLKPPRFVSEHVVRVINGNRTHAHALRKAYITTAHQHLCNYPEHAQNPQHHVDHRLGKLHESNRFAIFAPRRWLVGQAAGFSNIRGHDMAERFWNGRSSATSYHADQSNLSIKNLAGPPVAVLGPYRSGSSCVAGILHHLGLHLGGQLAAPNQHNTRGFFEPVWLSRQLRQVCDEPRLAELAPREYRVDALRQWLIGESNRAADSNMIIAGKHPLFCMLGEEIIEAWGPETRIISVYRPLEESLQSLERTGWWKQERRREILEKLFRSREAFLATHNHLKIEYDLLLADPASQVDRIIQYLRLAPRPEQITKATNFVGTPRIDSRTWRAYGERSQVVSDTLVVYTAISGNYDALHEQPPHDAQFIAFMDASTESQSWRVELLSPTSFDSNRNAKIVKVLSHRYLPNAQLSLWIDGSIVVNISPKLLVERYMGDFDMIVHRHPRRNCAYAEASVCRRRRLDTPRIIDAQMARYRTEGYPTAAGLYENTVILRRHNDRVRAFNELWWDEIKRGSKRDQLSAVYAAKKVGLRVGFFPGSIRSRRPDYNRLFTLFRHSKKRNASN